MPSSRQLAAIMFADITGYTGMMQEDETMALQLLQKLRRKLEVEVNRHQGRILEFRGDGALCRFSSTLEGVKAALAVQLEMMKDPVVPLRIGIHTGDVIIDGESIYGDGVNIASRLESLAVPGSIFISGKVHDDIKNRKDIQTVSLGLYILKNVKEQVEIYAISNAGIKIPDKSDLEGKGEKVQLKSILVLPFVNMSHESDQDYFSDGLTEELISNLSRLKEVRVISRTTSMKYKGTKKDIKTIGIETGASYVMEGSVRQHGNNLRITAQFVDAIRDMHLWADSYSGTLDEVFDIQVKVSSNIVEALRLQLTGSEKDTLQKKYTGNTDAYQLYLQGRHFWNTRSEDGLKTALRFFERAIEKDPEYALAWAGLADTYNLLGDFTNLSRRELYPKAKEAVNKALKLDHYLAEAHISLAAIIMLHEWDWENAGREYNIGIELNPNYATGHHWYAEWLLYHGRIEESLAEMALAVELDPVSQAIIKDQGIVFYYTRNYDKGIAMAITTLELNPHSSFAHRLFSLCYLGKGMYDEAIKENQLWAEIMNNDAKSNVALAQIYATAGRKEDALTLIHKIEESFPLTGNDYRGMALIYAALRDNDKAFEWLEKSWSLHEESLCSIKVDPKMDPIRSDPRFNDFVKKIGLIS
ncbi:MAG: adenylate/guanylate cyclase domain-containing protein [Saprospiraceae bacterium]